MPDVTYAELEIGLHRVPSGSYQVELRFADPENQAEVAPARGAAAIDPEALLALQHDARAYGEALAEQLFDDPAVRAAYGKAQAAIGARDLFLRARLSIGPSASELQALRWELLVDPESKAPLATSQKTLLSRFMMSQDWRTVRLRPKADLKALVAVSAPSDLERFQLAEVDLAGEVARARAGLEAIEIEVAGEDEPLTLERLVAGLRRGIDVLYLVCHGALVRGSPKLYLQDSGGKVKVADGGDLALRISELPEPPRLAVLASCQSAAAEDGAGGKPSAEAALATRLAEAGVPAVLAMQGRISMETVEQAMPVFFRELLEDGQIDRALAVARGAVRERPDSWMPALFLRLRGGRIWYVPGFGAGDDAVKWKALATDVRRGRFTPIVGWGLAEGIYGSPRDLAQRLAEANQFPLAPHQRGDLPLVSQYLLVHQSSSQYALDAVKEQMCRTIFARHRDDLEPELENASLAKLLRETSRLHRRDEADPYGLLARLPATVYINATPDTLLREALLEAGKEPDSVYAFWKDGLENPAYAGEPTIEKPLIYHIFGYLGSEDSLVLTEDDYFDYLIGATANKALVPKVVRHALANSALLFLGFQLTDWSFRTLFRLIVSQGGGARRRRFAHAAVQVDPEGNQLIDVGQARKYLEDYYGGENISIFWGSGQDFLKELEPRLGDAPAAREDDEF